MGQPRKLDIPLDNSIGLLHIIRNGCLLEAILNKPGKAFLRVLSPHQMSSQKRIFVPSAGSKI
jgi:hypothetical protein